MRLINTVVAFEGDKPRCSMVKTGENILIVVDDGASIHPYIAFNISRQGLVNFKNSILQAYEDLLRNGDA